MVVVAVAGGTGPGLGRCIVTILASNPNLKVRLLSRASSETPKWVEELGVEIRKVNYESEPNLKEALEGVHTVVSTILILDGTWGTTQITLLRAGLAAGISRFVPADWGTGRLSTPLIEIISTQSQVWDACEAAATAHPGRFEWASFHIGLFMNYLGLGSPHQEALAGLTDEHRFIWDIENMRAEIPLTAEGKIPRIAMTELWDVGRFLSFACELPFGQWEQDMGMAGDTKSMDEVVQIIEKVRGRKMEVTYRTFEQISSDAQVELDLVRKFWYELELAYARDVNGEGWYDTPLNDMSKGKVTPMNIEDYVTKYWGGV